MSYPSPTKVYHDATYPAIDPTLPQLSTKGKSVLVTGGGSRSLVGLGSYIARTFAKSGASNVGLVGRSVESLEDTKNAIAKESPATRVWAYSADLVDLSSITLAVEAFADDVQGKVDILVANAAMPPTFASLSDADPENWWQAFEVNVKGNFNLLKAFAPVAADDAVLIGLTSGLVHQPYLPLGSAYHVSKLAQAKLFDYAGHENPNWRVVQFHPGIFNSETSNDPLLPANFAVWLASSEANFLKGKQVWAQWDVDELKAMAGELQDSSKFTLGLLG